MCARKNIGNWYRLLNRGWTFPEGQKSEKKALTRDVLVHQHACCPFIFKNNVQNK